MNNISIFLSLLLLSVVINSADAFEPDTSNALELEVQGAIINIKQKDPTIQIFFDNSAGYAIYPSIGKGGLIVGGSYGTGLVIANEQVDGYTTTTQISVGAQIGAQKYALYVFFKDQVALEHFKRENFEFSAQASAVAVTEGTAVKTPFDAGVAVFTITDGGLMAEATIGGQRFTYKAKN